MSRAYMYGGYRYGGYSMPKATGLPQKYPEDIQCVYPSSDPTKGAIYVSNVEAASNHLTLSKHNIKAVMTCAKGYDRNIPRQRLQMYEYFPFDDKQTCQISPYFEKASDFIVNALSKTNILVHCIAGVSRSVSMVLAYLIRQKEMSYQQAYHTVKSRRSIISPNDGFIRQLKQYALEIKDRMNRPSNRTPTKQRYANNQNSVSPTKNNDYTQRIYRTSTKQPEVSQKIKDSVANEQDYELRRGVTDNWISIGKNKSNYIEQVEKQGMQNRNHSVGFVKSQNFIDVDRVKTPEKVRVTQQRHTQARPTSRYFQQMNEDLNNKIQAIHAKYQKQRQALLSKRLANNTATATKQHRSFSNKNNFTPYTTQYSKFLDSTQGGLGTQRKKYVNMYDNKYARGLDYEMRTGGKTFNIGGYYRGRYF